MSTPGFTAAASIFNSSKSYIGTAYPYGGNRSRIVGSLKWTPIPSKGCDSHALQAAADTLCEQTALAIYQQAGYDTRNCVAFCQSKNYKHDADCNVTDAGSCSCEVDCT